MEQYEIAPEIFLETLERAFCLYKPEHIFIRQIGSQGGKTMVRVDLKGKRLDVKKVCGGFNFLVNRKVVFFWKTTQKHNRISGKNWSLAYERQYANGEFHYASCGYNNPDYPNLPKVTKTTFRAVNENYFAVITFDDKIPVVVDEAHTDRKKHPAFWRWKLKT